MTDDRRESFSPTPLVEVVGLCKHYPEFTLSDVSFSVEAGSITGFIGRNGAGKSTTLKCLEGSVHPDGGSIAYFGSPFAGHESEAKRRIGFELGGADFYRTKRVAQIAQVTRRFYDNWDEASYAKYCKLFNIDQGKRVKELSQGMRVKFTLALALSHRSQLLVLDEPTSGLDPASREEVLDIFLTLARQQGTGVLFSTHITSDLDKCADSNRQRDPAGRAPRHLHPDAPRGARAHPLVALCGHPALWHLDRLLQRAQRPRGQRPFVLVLAAGLAARPGAGARGGHDGHRGRGGRRHGRVRVPAHTARHQ